MVMMPPGSEKVVSSVFFVGIFIVAITTLIFMCITLWMDWK